MNVPRLIGALLAGTAVTIVLAVAAIVAVEVVEARRGIPPDGPTCDYETDVGSGPVGSGVERVERTPLLPERRCLATTGEGAGASWPRAYEPGRSEDLARWALLVGGLPLVAGTVTALVVARALGVVPAQRHDGRHT